MEVKKEGSSVRRLQICYVYVLTLYKNQSENNQREEKIERRQEIIHESRLSDVRNESKKIGEKQRVRIRKQELTVFVRESRHQARLGTLSFTSSPRSNQAHLTCL